MKKLVLLTIVAAAASAMYALAQEAPREGREGRGERGERGERGREFNPEQMRERMRQFMSTRVKEQLKATDEEWAVIEPLLNRVSDLRRQTRGGGQMMGRGGPANPPPAEGAEVSPLRKAQDALRQAVDGEGTPAETIKARLDEYRTARTGSEAELKKAQDELRAVLSVRQEAQLVLMGILD